MASRVSALIFVIVIVNFCNPLFGVQLRKKNTTIANRQFCKKKANGRVSASSGKNFGHKKTKWSRKEKKEEQKILESEKVLEAETIAVTKIKETLKKAFRMSRGDWDSYIGGSIRLEYFTYHNNCLLNSKVPDTWGGFKQTTSILFDIIYGKKTHGHKAAEVFMDLRNKHKWGIVGVYKFTTKTDLSIAGASIGEHAHRNARPTPWFKEAWIKTSFNSIFKLKTEKLHFLKMGWFPYSIGRGIAFGDAYATAYEYLGLFSYFADASAPGVLISGELVKDKLFYDLYYSKFEDNSIWITETFNTSKSYHIGRKYTPWSGISTDDELWSARLKWKAFDSKSSGQLNVEPYIYYNKAPDQKVEFAKDVKTELGAAGLSLDYKNGNFEWGAEGAFNYGSEKLYHIDRNRIKYKKNDNGFLEQQYTKVVINNSNGVAAIVTSNNAGIVKNYDGYENDANIGGSLYNTYDRFRPSYKNDLCGWMMVSDMSYQIKDWNLNISTEFGYFTGDEDPHYLSKNIDKQYDKHHEMFIGLHELYQGRKVLSALFLGEREIVFPLSLEKGEREAEGYRAAFKSTALLNDLIYWGAGLTFQPAAFKKRHVEIKPNVMLFWKNTKSFKYVTDGSDPDNWHVSSTDYAGRFMGTEINAYFSIDLIKDMTLFGVFALFFPGTYYKDIKGVPVGSYLGDFYRKNFKGDPNVNPLDYRMSTDTATFVNIAIKYVF